MKVLLVGGNFGEILEKRESGIIKKIYTEFQSPASEIDVINGGKLTDLPDNIKGYDLILWMINIDNSEQKYYPSKDQGSVLICSKVMRSGYTRIDSLSRIFKMHGNAVIEIYKDDPHNVRFCFLDALGNEWYNGSDITSLVKQVLSFYIFTKSAVRINTTQIESPAEHNLRGLIEANKRLQGLVMSRCGNRFFGNISTRCTKLFPSMRDSEAMYVSPRNVPKENIRPEDMIVYMSGDNYYGDHKPSVDSPTQIRLYHELPNINFMIHGHATFQGIITTRNYRLCGDIREVQEVLELVKPDDVLFRINLKNHGFLIGAYSLEMLNDIIDWIENGDLGEIKITNR